MYKYKKICVYIYIIHIVVISCFPTHCGPWHIHFQFHWWSTWRPAVSSQVMRENGSCRVWLSFSWNPRKCVLFHNNLWSLRSSCRSGVGVGVGWGFSKKFAHFSWGFFFGSGVDCTSCAEATATNNNSSFFMTWGCSVNRWWWSIYP